MKSNLTFILLILIYTNHLNSQELSSEKKDAIKKLIIAVKSKNKSKIADFISFPLKREFPLPNVNNKTEFISRFDEIFDEKLISLMIQSNINIDWSEVGWRGIMLNQGDVWIDDQAKIQGINYRTNKEQTKFNKLIILEKSKIHTSLKEFIKPIYILKTEKYVIRIDKMSDTSFRYASWSKSKSINEKPDLIILNGNLNIEGSGGNHSYLFKNEEYTYECSIINLGTDNDPDARLIVYKNEKKILSQDATLIPSLPKNLFINSR